MSTQWSELRRLTIRRLRRPTDDLKAFPWHLDMVPKPAGKDDVSAAASVWRTAIFVVHGIGTQTIAETAAALRSGSDDMLEQIKSHPRFRDPFLPAPYIRDGYWANYADVKSTFEKELRPYNQSTKDFFETLWKQRFVSLIGTVGWFLGQQLRLLWSALTLRVMPWVVPTYVLMQLPLLFTWVFALLRHPKIVSGYLTDVRLYMRPKGVTEGAIVQRIDQSVRTRVMQLLGLSSDFIPLEEYAKLDVAGDRVAFEKVVWVAHSLGTVISYNVLSDLMRQADEIEKLPPEPQHELCKEGVRRFREGLARFVTFGSPLDKVASLYPHRLTPWRACARKQEARHPKPWWVNCYHVLDPVSGALDARRVCRCVSPANFHIKLAHLPIFAHVAYWRDTQALWFVLASVYKNVFELERQPEPMTARKLTLLALAGYFVWTLLIAVAAVGAVIWLVSAWSSALARTLVQRN